MAEQEQTVALLEHKNRILSKEKFDLISRLESVRDLPDTSTEGPCLKVSSPEGDTFIYNTLGFRDA